jgi:hypothetical protein
MFRSRSTSVFFDNYATKFSELAAANGANVFFASIGETVASHVGYLNIVGSWY